MIPPEIRFERFRNRPDENGCIRWKGSLWEGYGRIRVEGRDVLTHRFAWELARRDGILDSTDEIDHKCRVRNCVNPDHLQRVPQGFNGKQGREQIAVRQRAKTHCPQGHPYDEANTYVDKQGKRSCRACQRERDCDRKRRARLLARAS